MGVTLRSKPTFKAPNGASPVEGCERIPTDPPFTLKQIKDAVPPHCFKRSLVKSLMYLALDLSVISSLYCAAMWLYNSAASLYVQCVLWPAYWYAQGAFAFGLWTLGHECGHYAFCDSKKISNAVGLVIHTMLLIPYYSFQITHRKHHGNTNRMDGDEGYVPSTRSLLTYQNDLAFPNTLRRLLHVVKYLLFGWPGYALVHARGRRYPPSSFMPKPNHFNPYAPFFSRRDFWWVVVSDVALLAWMGLLYFLSTRVYSWSWVLCLYVVPMLVHNAWFVIVTYLQHTDIRVPHYSDEDWTWIKGALCTVDRDYGLLNYVFHHLPDTHVAHHLFPYMPHYHAVEATEAFKKVLGKYYQYDDTPVWRALWKTDSYCRFVEDHGSTLWYKHLPEQWEKPNECVSTLKVILSDGYVCLKC